MWVNNCAKMLQLLILLFGELAFFGLAYNITQYTQDDYIVISERFEVGKYDPAFVANPITHNFKYNRSLALCNFTWTFVQNLDNSLTLDTQAYKFASNEYRLFPINFPVNFCDILKRNIFGIQNLYNCGKMFRCPIKKGNYNICNWMPDYSKFPPHMPRGSYMISTKWTYYTVETIDVQWYFTIKDAKFLK